MNKHIRTLVSGRTFLEVRDEHEAAIEEFLKSNPGWFVFSTAIIFEDGLAYRQTTFFRFGSFVHGRSEFGDSCGFLAAK